MIPSVSVIVPVKNSQATIAKTLRSLFAQTYPGHIEIIVVGHEGDKTWLVEETQDPRVTRINIPNQGMCRDSNMKRNAGLAAATGAILALTDSDIVVHQDWIGCGVLKMQYGAMVVAGGMHSADDGFWSRYVDGVSHMSKTPRIGSDYYLDARTFGQPGYKPPITANVFLRRQVYEAIGPLDERFQFSYDDYPWFWKIVDAGYAILCTPALEAEHHHRFGAKLLKEYVNSGKGCADFIRWYGDSPMALRRGIQLGMCITYAIGILLFFAILIALQQGAFCLAFGVGSGLYLLMAGVINVYWTRDWTAIIFPVITNILGCAFVYGALTQFLEVRHEAA